VSRGACTYAISIYELVLDTIVVAHRRRTCSCWLVGLGCLGSAASGGHSPLGEEVMVKVCVVGARHWVQ
jgi:hypothetical protein